MEKTIAMTQDEKIAVNGSGLFYWNSDLKDAKKLEILKWYNSLKPFEKQYIDMLRDEASDSASEGFGG